MPSSSPSSSGMGAVKLARMLMSGPLPDVNACRLTYGVSKAAASENALHQIFGVLEITSRYKEGQVEPGLGAKTETRTRTEEEDRRWGSEEAESTECDMELDSSESVLAMGSGLGVPAYVVWEVKLSNQQQKISAAMPTYRELQVAAPATRSA